MIVDVDIHISNDEGVPIQNFSKRFDGRFEGERISNTYVSGKKFEEFLAEYLSNSGRMYRENLLLDKTITYMDNEYKYANNSRKPEVNQLEYYIKIGENQSISGKVPLKRLMYLNGINELQENEDKEFEERQVNEGDKSIFNYVQRGDTGYIKLENVMLEKAISKYEDNFFHIYDDIEEFNG